jgi:hypothetical protein
MIQHQLRNAFWKALLGVGLAGTLLSSPLCLGQIQESFFGLHQNKYTRGEPWPTVPFSIRRTVSDRLTWDDVETCPGGPDPGNSCYHWGHNREDGDFDKVINDSAAHGVDVMFTVYDTPGWISNRGERCRAKGVPDANCAGPADVDCGRNSIGLCDPPADVDAVVGSGEGDGSDKTFKDFVTAVATRYGKKIKYWEMWNEAPNIRSANPEFWTFKQWARMTKDFHDAVKAVNPDAVILAANTCHCWPHGSADFEDWTEGYFAALDKYGPSIVDGITFHGYFPRPERNVDIVHMLTDIMNKHASVRGKPIYDSEDAWPGGDVFMRPNGKPDWDMRSAWMARSFILTASLGVKKYIFFGWDLGPVGQMWSRDPQPWDCTLPNKNGAAGYLCPTAPAYEQVRSWLLGAVFDKECDAQSLGLLSGKAWVCDFSKNGGSYRGRFVWSEGTDSVSYTPERQFVMRRELDGSTAEVKKGAIQIGPRPVLLETK